jgi:pimeloyl-ACP methyl ester carboxylesterase
MFRRCVLVVCLLGSAAWCQPASQKNPITGEWNGTIAGQLRVSVHVDRAEDNSLHASLESIDQGHQKINVDEVSFDGQRSVRFELKTIGASYQAELNPDGSELAGTWQQGGARVPLTLRRSDAPPVKPLEPVMHGRVPLTPCPAAGGQGLCGTFEVFENRAARTGRKIPLHILILPAQSEKPAADPVFGFAGGPGQSAAEAFPLVTAMVTLRRQHDLVLIDQRGTGKSNPLPCPTDDKDAQLFLRGSGGSAVKDLPACRKELEARADLTEYTTSNSADDVDDVRAALGYEKIDALGGSYGTLAALVYLRRHGEHVRSVVLEGVATPDYRLPLAFAKTIQESLGHLFADCAADPACHKEFPNLKTEFETVVQRLTDQPATFQLTSGPDKGQTVTITRGAFVSALRPLLYQPGIVSRLPYIFHRAFDNDFNPYATVSAAMRRAVGQSVARGMSYSVTCSESLPFISERDIRRETAGTYLGDFDVRNYQKNCAIWPHAKVSKDYLKPVRSDVPVLLIAGAEDPATPASWAEHAAASLSNSRVVVIPHGTHLTASQCTDNMIVQFINQGSSSGIDTGCVSEIRNPPFVTSP